MLVEVLCRENALAFETLVILSFYTLQDHTLVKKKNPNRQSKYPAGREHVTCTKMGVEDKGPLLLPAHAGNGHPNR